MKTRQIELLRIILNHQVVDMSKILIIFDISKRTLFYDLEEINFRIQTYGKLKVVNNQLVIEGDLSEIENGISEFIIEPFYQSKERKERMLLSILENEKLTLDQFSDMFKVSRSTVFSDIELVKSDLLHEGVELEYLKGYMVSGNEWKIRDIYLQLFSLKEFNFDRIDDRIIQFNLKNELNLSDYSLFYLNELIDFINKRNQLGHYVSCDLHQEDLTLDVSGLLNSNHDDEKMYLNAYIRSLTTMTGKEVPTMVARYVKALLSRVRVSLAIDVLWDDYFVNNLENHLIASFYRIKYGFPAINMSLTDIKVKYFYLYLSLKNVIVALDNHEVLSQMRDEEIGFVAAYIGGYLYDMESDESLKHKVILVCPQGRVVSHNLRNEIEKGYENIHIVGTYSINQLGHIVESYDYIISTIDLPYYNNVITVHPILSEYDKDKLDVIFKKRIKDQSDLIDEVMHVIDEHAEVMNKSKLKNELLNILEGKEKVRRYQPMLEELVQVERIQVLDSVSDWKTAIQISSQPLLDDGVIDETYVDTMIGAVNEYGPYIVLADEFALPHASNQPNVKEVAISTLVLREPVDMEGKPVRIVMTLATVDNQSHLKALSSLVEIISDDENLQQIKDGSVEEIYKILKEGGGK